MKTSKYYSLLFAVLVVVITSCSDYDNFTVDPAARLIFSEYTVKFDTVITSQSSPTRQLLVWNNNKQGVRISHVQLGNGSNSFFRVNVDGQYLYNGSGDDFEIRGRDSIFVKIEVQLPQSAAEPNPHYEDDLVFFLESGAIQSVRLIADGIDVYLLKGVTLTADTTFTADRPLWIKDSLIVEEGVTLSIEPGTRLLFHDEVDFVVRGTLKAEGTVDKPIVFRGDRLDHLFPYLPYDNTTNRWGGIKFTPTSKNNVMVQCDVHSGTFGIRCDSTINLSIDVPILRLTNSIIHNVGGHGLDVYNSNVEVVGTQISNTLGHTIKQVGGISFFVHCTIAQFYPFSVYHGNALYMTNRKSEDEVYPLQALFFNSVITGLAEDVIMGDLVDVEGLDYLPYLFHHCLLRTIETDDETHFVNVIYDNKDKIQPSCAFHFRVFDNYNYIYDFTPVEKSAIRGKADVEYTQLYSLIDRRGVTRLQEGGADLGAYQYVPEAKDDIKE